MYDILLLDLYLNGEGGRMPANDIWFMIALFIFGGILMILELIMPGFGVAGIAGIVSLIAGIVVGSSVLTSGQLAVVIFLVFVFIVNNGGVVIQISH